MENINEEYAEYYLKLKNLGYEEITLRHMDPDDMQEDHFHPFTASMIIIKGNVTIQDERKIYKLVKGDFISVESMKKHKEKTDIKGATFLYGKKYNGKIHNRDIIQLMIEEYDMADQKWPLVAYIRKSPASFMLYVFLYQQYYTEIWHSQEGILNSIPKRYGSRSTVLNILTDGIERKTIIKKSRVNDKRSVYYELSFNIFEEMSSWINTKHDILVNIFKK